MINQNKTTQKWVITAPNNACGTGAGGLQFANGKAECFDERIANWYKNRGYTVIVEAPKASGNAGKNQDNKEPENKEPEKEPNLPPDPDKTEDTKEPEKESV